jgi:hypothetical protein
MTVSIGRLLDDAIEKINQDDLEMAVLSVSIAVAGTSTKAFPQKQKNGKKYTDSEKYKDFLKRHMGLIVFAAIPGLALAKGSSIRLGFTHPDIPKDSHGLCTLEDILYHVVRCGLIHEAVFPATVKFGNSLSGDGNLPKGLLHGLILAVIVAPENRDESLPRDWVLEIKGKPLALNDYWGREQKLAHFLGLRFLYT